MFNPKIVVLKYCILLDAIDVYFLLFLGQHKHKTHRRTRCVIFSGYRKFNGAKNMRNISVTLVFFARLPNTRPVAHRT